MFHTSKSVRQKSRICYVHNLKMTQKREREREVHNVVQVISPYLCVFCVVKFAPFELEIATSPTLKRPRLFHQKAFLGRRLKHVYSIPGVTRIQIPEVVLQMIKTNHLKSKEETGMK